jgi:hypothetical protein
VNTFGKFGLPDLIRAQVKPLLAAHGYRQKGLLFIREREEVWQLVGFQKSVQSTAEATSVTVNLSITSKRIVKFLKEDWKPSMQSYHWLERIGMLGPQHKDTWWWLTSTSMEGMLEIVDLIQHAGLSELEKLSSDSALRDLWLSGYSPGLGEEERLVNLSALLAEIGPSEALAGTVARMRELEEDHKTYIVTRQLERLAPQL